ncbi:MAG: molybdopterin molybdotransferase MoeA [Stagnimonas sp.]|nr:molybdopterin molybdotransferase MoeA [Stagnimonas sp.]
MSFDSPMISVDEALRRVVSAAPPIGCESLPLAVARGRVLSADVYTHHAMPSFTQSAVDGYAVRHADLHVLPCTLPLGPPIAARAHAELPVLPSAGAVRILTGGLLPYGADTVVRQEHTEHTADAVKILHEVAAGADIRHAGEEMPPGARLAVAGQLVTPGLIGALALAGVDQVPVWRLPRVIVLVTGDELVPAGTCLKLGQVPDANGPMLQAFLSAWGVPPLRIEAVADNQPAVRNALTRAFADADLVLTTGGVSVGDHDYVPAVAEALGSQRVLWKVAQKPGMPLYVARHRDTLLFGLPGNPASVLVNLLVYVRAALDNKQGLDPQSRWHPISMREQPKRDALKTLWLRAIHRSTDELLPSAHILQGQASHMLGNLAEANLLLRVQPQSQSIPGGNNLCCVIQ